MVLTKQQILNSKELRSKLFAASLIFCLTLLIFMSSHVHQVTDTTYSMLVSESLVKHRSFTLDSYALPRYEPTWWGYYFKDGPLYQLEFVDGHLYHQLPPGTPVLSTPYVALLNSLGISAANPDGTYNPRGEVMIEASLAAILMALLACVFFFTARLALPTAWSVVLALGGSFGTQVYSTASRALWSDTWGILLLGVVIFLLLAQEMGQRRCSPILLATLLAWTYFVRPTFVLPIIAVTIYLLMFHRRLFLVYAATGAAWFSAFIYYSRYHFGRWLPSYYMASRLHTDTFWVAFAGNLISPARGLLVYVPALFFVAYLLVRYRQHLQYPRLVWLSLSVVISHLIVISGFPHWWGGHSFGPRLATGLVPWFMLLAILGLQAMLSARETLKPTSGSLLMRRAEFVSGGLLLALSLFINTVGATERATWIWNLKPQPIDDHPERLWDWRQPQFLAKFLPYPPPQEFAELSGTRVDFSTPGADKYLWYGWSEDEAGSHWADNDATVIFRLENRNTQALQLNLSPFIVPGKLDSQSMKVTLNEQPLTTFTLRDSQPQIYSLTLPADLLREKNILRFEMPNAQSPQTLRTGEDPRLRSFKLQWIELEAAGNK
jgi:hypothetical protein